MNKNPVSKTSKEDLSECINPKLDKYWKRQKEVIDDIFGIKFKPVKRRVRK